MVLIAGLIGIGLALEASERRKANRNALARRHNLLDEQDSQHDSLFFSETSPAQQDERAFQEVQNYADFQKFLSERVNDDILEDVASSNTKYAPESPVSFSHNISQHPYLDPALFSPVSKRFLPSPIIIPQQISEDGIMVWKRAYSPLLWQWGITKEAFFNFIDRYNEVTKTSPHTEVFNILGLGAGQYSSITQVLASGAVSMAVRVAKESQSPEPSDAFLRQSNEQFFVPHGLYAMVATFSQREPKSYSFDNSQPYPTHSVPQGTEAAHGSPKRLRGHKNETGKPLRRPNSRRKLIPKTDGLLQSPLEGSFANRMRGRGHSVSNVMKEIMGGSREERAFIQPVKAEGLKLDTIYLLIVDNSPEHAALMSTGQIFRLPFRSSATFDGSERVEVPQNGDPPPDYETMMKTDNIGSRPKEGAYCIPTL